MTEQRDELFAHGASRLPLLSVIAEGHSMFTRLSQSIGPRIADFSMSSCNGGIAGALTIRLPTQRP